MELILEVLTRSGKVKSFFKITQPTIKIGRAYDNDIVLKDQFMCPYHATLNIDDDRFSLQDNHSVNGINDAQNKPLGRDVSLALNQVFLMGGQYMRIVSSQSQTLSQTVKLTALEYLSQMYNRWHLALLGILVLFCSMVLDAYLATYVELNWSKLLISNGLTPVISVLGTGVILAIAAVLFSKEVKFFTSIIVVCVGFILFKLAISLMNIINFNLGDGLVVFSLEKVFVFGFFSFAIFSALFLTTHLNSKKIAAIAVGLVLTGQSIHHWDKTSGDRVKSYPSYTESIYPEYLLVTPEQEVSTWVKQTASIYQKSSEDAQRRNEAKL